MVCSINEFIKNRHWLVINVLCLIFFFCQFGGVLDGYIDPVNTNTVVGTQDLQYLAFPVIFKICVTPAFNKTFLYEAGYDGIEGYFTGRSKFNESKFGWAGHGNGSKEFGNVTELMNKARLHDVKDIFIDVTIWSLKNQLIEISLDSVKVLRPTYPSNCYTLDLGDNLEVKEQGVKQVFFDLTIMNNYSMEILLEDRSLACYREIKYNNFYSSGPDIILDNLGQKISEYVKLT